MKNSILLTAVLAATSLTAGAQAQQTVLKANAFNAFGNVKAKLEKPANLKAEQLAVSAPQRSIEDGVYYGRPSGVYYSGYTFGNDDPAWLVPGISPVTYVNSCTSPMQATWSQIGSNGTADLSGAADVDNNLVLTWGPNLYNTSDDFLIGYNAPTISVGNKAFTAQYVQAVANCASDQVNYSPNQKTYIGYQDGPAFGTGSVYENALASQLGNELKEIKGTIEFFEKPVAPMLVESFSVYFISYQEDPLNGKELTLNIYGFDEQGSVVREPKEVLTCKSVEILGSAQDNAGETFWQGVATFSKKTQDEFGEEIADPFVIDYNYAAEFTGYNQEGVDVEIPFAEIEDAYEMLNSSSTSYACEMNDGEVRNYYFGGDQARIKARIFATVFYDGVELLDPYKSLEISADGQTCTTDNPNMEESSQVNFVPVTTAAPFFTYDENGEPTGQNYDVEGLPDWLDIDGVTDESREQYGYSAIFFKAEPLPADTEGRYATIYIVGRGGVKNAQPITVRQGSVTGIGTVIAEGDANATYYNVSGQRVKNAKGLVISKAGKRIVK